MATGIITVTAPANGEGITYTITGTSPVVAAVTNSTGIFSGLAAGSYNVTTTNSAGCTSSPTSKVIDAQPATPSAPTAIVTQPTCEVATGTITVTTPSNAIGITYTVTGTSPVVAAVTNSTGIFSGLVAGSYNITTTNSASCTSSPISKVIVAQPGTCSAGIFHTRVSCSDYKNNASNQLVGQLCYKTSGTKINNVTPGQFFYYTAIVAPSQNFDVDVVQTNSCGFSLFKLQQNDQIILWNSNCVKVASGNVGTATQGKIRVSNAVPGQLYVLSVKYDTKSLIGLRFTGTSCTYNFESKIGTNVVPRSRTSIDMVINCISTTTKIAADGTTVTAKSTEDNTTAIAKSSFDVVSYANPSQSFFRFYLETISEELVTFRIFNMQGNLIEKREVTPNDVNVFEIGDRYPAGVYIVKVTQGENVKSLRIIKE